MVPFFDQDLSGLCELSGRPMCFLSAWKQALSVVLRFYLMMMSFEPRGSDIWCLSYGFGVCGSGQSWT